MHFASHLRPRLGEFTVGTELHRSESLALVQLLILYHLVTARADDRARRQRHSWRGPDRRSDHGRFLRLARRASAAHFRTGPHDARA